MASNPVIGERYELLHVLGSGGMGKVYNAFDMEKKTNVALKLIEFPVNKGDQVKKRFLLEVSALSKLDHPSIVKLYDFGVHGTMSYISMELVKGKQLNKINDRTNLLSYFQQIANALVEVHSHNMIHRDIKPDNILITEGESPKAVLVDFGIVKQNNLTQRLTSTGSVIGTISYMSPEQIMGIDIDARSDLYSLGCVMYESLTGVLPFQAEDISTQISKVLSERPKKPSLYDKTVSPAFEAIIMKLLEKNPNQRYKNALELKIALEELISNFSFDTVSTQVYQTKLNAFVGRKNLIQAFEKQLMHAQNQSGSVLNLFGPEGYGKSRLLLEWESISLSKGAKFILIETGSRNPVKVLLDKVSDFITQEKASIPRIYDNANLLSGISQKLAEKLSFEPHNDELEQTKLVITARNLIEAIFEDETLVLAIDEVRDPLLTAVVKKLAKNIESKRFFIVDATVSQADSAFITLINSENSLMLEPLTQNEVSELAQLTLGKSLPYLSIEKIHSASSGNPLYVSELLNDIGRGSTTIEMVPVDLKQLFREKIRKLSSNSLILLEKMAILKRPMPINDLKAIARLSDEVFSNSMIELLSLGLVSERYSFSQMDIGLSSPLITQIFLEDTVGFDLKKTCNELATTLEIISSGNTANYDSEIGSFYLLSGDVEKGVKYLYSNIKRNSEINNEQAIHSELRLIEPVLSNIENQWFKTKLMVLILASKTMQGNIADINKYINIFIDMIKNGLLPDDLQIDAYLEVAFAYMETDQVDKGSEFMDLLKKKIPSEALKDNIKYWKIIAQIFIRQDKPELAEKPANMIVMLSHKTNNKRNIANALSYQAVVCSLNNKHETAIDLLEQARQIGSDLNDMRLELRALNNLAGVYFESERYIEAEKTLNQAITISEKLELMPSVIENLYRLLPIMDWKGDFNGLRQVLAKMKALLDENPNSQFYSEYLSHNITLLISDADFSSAQAQIDQLNELAMKTNRPVLIRSAMVHKTFLLYYQGKYDKCLNECNKLEYLFECAHSEDVLVERYFNCFLASRACIKLGNISHAEDFFKKGSQLLEQYKEAPKNHGLEKELARFFIEWSKSNKKNKPNFINRFRTQKSESVENLLFQLKASLENVDIMTLSQNKPMLEMLVLFMDICIDQYKYGSVVKKDLIDDYSFFASHCAEKFIDFYSKSGTRLFKDDLLLRNNELASTKRESQK